MKWRQCIIDWIVVSSDHTQIKCPAYIFSSVNQDNYNLHYHLLEGISIRDYGNK